MAARKPLLGRILGLAFLLGVFLSASALWTQASPGPEAPLPPHARSVHQYETFPEGPPRREDTFPKLEWVLGELLLAHREGGWRRAAALAEERLVMLRGEEVRVVLEAEDGEEVAQEVAALGGLVEASYGDWVQALVPLKALPALADKPAVRFIRQPMPFRPAAVLSEGVRVVGGDAWQRAGYRGQGVKVAVLDAGFEGYSSRLGSELPPTVTTRSFRSDGNLTPPGENHGTAVAEIVYDAAPAASLYLVNFETEVELGRAVDWLLGQDIHIITMSGGFPTGGPGDGTGPINAIVARARQNGVLWVNAAGNYAQRHWAGTFFDPDGNDIHNFALDDEGLSLFLVGGRPAEIILRWNDWAERRQDYDLLLYHGRGAVAVSRNNQSGASTAAPPVEIIRYAPPIPGTYAIAIVKYRASRSVDFDLFVDGYDLEEYIVSARSLAVPADGREALAVGATRWDNDALEPFSSRGPTNDGRTKPDLVAPDRVSTSVYGSGGFAGTSAAAPHVAGATALVRSAYPSFTAAQLQSFLEQRAQDLGAPGPDNLYGSGRLALGPPPTPTPTPSPTPIPTPIRTPTPTLTPPLIKIYLPILAQGRPVAPTRAFLPAND